MYKIYLCGGIQYVDNEESTTWRNYAKSKLYANVFNCLDPMRRNFRSNELESRNEIIAFDKADIINSDILLVNATKPSWGTAMEIMFGFIHHKIIIAWVGNKYEVSPWVKYHSTQTFKELDDAILYINNHFGDVK